MNEVSDYARCKVSSAKMSTFKRLCNRPSSMITLTLIKMRKVYGRTTELHEQ